jgi:hypothetical protein
MVDMGPAFGVGLGDLKTATGREWARLLREAGGDELKAVGLVMVKLQDAGWITESEVQALTEISEINYAATAGTREAKDGHRETLRVYEELLASASPSPVALAIASAATGSYSLEDAPDGSGNVVYKKGGQNWEIRLGALGALIGGKLDNGFGAAVGAAVGGAIGHVVDKHS